MDIINNDLKTLKIDNPYDIWVIDNFLKKDIIENIIKYWPSDTDPSWHFGHTMIEGKTNILEQGTIAISKVDKMPLYIGELTKYFHSKEFTYKIQNILNLKGLIPDTAMRWSGMRIMKPNSFQLIHSDARKSTETGLRKELTCLLYLNENYNKEKDEGCLEIWNDEMNMCTHEIEPKLNRLVVFINSDTSYHGVPLVKSTRKFITFSILKEGAVTERTKALFVARPTDPIEVKIQGIERSQIKDAN